MKKDQKKYRFTAWYEEKPNEVFPLYAGTLEGITEIRDAYRKISGPKLIFGPIEIARWEIVKGKAERGTKQEETEDVH